MSPFSENLRRILHFARRLTGNVGTRGTDAVHVEANAARVLRDQGALLQRVVDPFNAVVLHGEEEAGRHLWLRRAGVEEGGRGVGEILLRHVLVGLKGEGAKEAKSVMHEKHGARSIR